MRGGSAVAAIVATLAAVGGVGSVRLAPGAARAARTNLFGARLTAAAAPRPARLASRARARRTEADDDAAPDAAALARKRRYINLTGFPFPLGPLFSRATCVTELHRGRVWLFEQEQSLGFGVGSTIAANSRMVVVRLASGELWVLNPLAPTAELVEALRALGGRVAHVVLGSTQYEHKVFVPPFARALAADQPRLWIVPDQWAFPLDLPNEALGLIGARVLRDDLPAAIRPPWAAELPYTVLRPRARLGLGYAAVEAAFVHRATRTLLLTDGLVRVPREPPAVLDRLNLRALGSPGNLLSRGAAFSNWRGRGAEIREADAADAAEALRAAALKGARPERAAAAAEARGWQRNAVLALYFGPSVEAITDPPAAFDSLAERWLVGPVCATLIYSSSSVRGAVGEWVERICALGKFDTIVPAHFAAARGTPADLRAAFAPVLADAPERPYRAADVRLLSDLSKVLKVLGVI